MKLAAKKLRDELKAGRRSLVDQIVAAMLPAETQTPKTSKMIEKAVEMIAIANGTSKNIDSLTEEQVLKMIERLGTTLPFLRRTLKDVSKKLPHDPGGRRKKFSNEQRIAVVQEVASLMIKGEDLHTAKAMLARRHNVSLSTIQRAWKERKGLLPKT
jgi:ribosome maturation protein Sdo1